MNNKETRIVVIMYDGTSTTKEVIEAIGGLLGQECDAQVAHVLEYNSKQIADIRLKDVMAMLAAIAEPAPLNITPIIAAPVTKVHVPKYNEEELAVIYIAKSIGNIEEMNEFGVFSAAMVRFAKFGDERDDDGRKKFVNALHILSTKEILNISKSLLKKYNLSLAKIDGLKKAYQTLVSAGIIPL